MPWMTSLRMWLVRPEPQRNKYEASGSSLAIADPVISSEVLVTFQPATLGLGGHATTPVNRSVDSAVRRRPSAVAQCQESYPLCLSVNWRP